MKCFLFLAIVLFAFPAFAGKKGKTACTLKNTKFCRVWHDTDGFRVTVTGDRIIHHVFNVTETCSIIKEQRFEDGRPISLLMCDYPATTAYEAFKIGEMLVWLPQEKMYKGMNIQFVKMCEYPEDYMVGPCFSANPAEKQFCDLRKLYTDHPDCNYDMLTN